MGKFIDLTGQRFGKLVVIEKYGIAKNRQSLWRCKCDCGNMKIVMYNNLTTKQVKSCGCLLKENGCPPKHGLSQTRLYRINRGMINRCYKKQEKDYKNYGGRGIKICSEWLNKENGFINFYNWSINNGYKDNLTIDRINVNGNYEPNNCRWATIKEQSNNKRNNHNLTYKGKTYTITEWARILKITYATMLDRTKKNFPEELLFYKGKMTKRIRREYEKKNKNQ